MQIVFLVFKTDFERKITKLNHAPANRGKLNNRCKSAATNGQCVAEILQSGRTGFGCSPYVQTVHAGLAPHTHCCGFCLLEVACCTLLIGLTQFYLLLLKLLLMLMWLLLTAGRRLSICCCCVFALIDLFRVQVNGHNQAVETQHFGEDENQDHAHEQSRLLCCATDTGVSHDADRKTSCQTREAHRQTGSQVNEAPGH